MKQLPKRALWLGTALTLVLAGCSTSGDESDVVKIGLITPLSGIYQEPGEEMRNGFQLYLDTHGGKLGGREVELLIGNEGEGPETAVDVAEKFILQDEVAALTGVMAGGSYAEISVLAQEHNMPLIGSGGRPTLDPDKLEGLWHTSWISDENGQAIAPYMAENIDGPVYAIGPDYQGGHDQLRGFTETFAEVGGQLANPTGETHWTPFPETTNFTPYFTEIAQTDAAAIYAFFAGTAAVDFVTQWAQSNAKDIPLYGSFITEGSVLDAQGDAAEGVYSVMNYSADLDNAANREFVAAWSAAGHPGQPALYSVCAWDAAQVLDRAIATIPPEMAVTPEVINDAIAALGEIDSPRGAWRFSEIAHAPIQKWYLRQVQLDGQQLANVVIEDLATIGG
ncbi:amino acid/amide ABC transporter substrate-binding protein (HAAT family) [Stackebrandtia endophytica]|uniref:Amino acid/amide ABC transporter substrate-binding protein (HAAT family) n=1 Tax=Stackebrandtia endophytica TaxID=1496996 RepID=A0A543B000_9ACTN|nr:ABC transporter substrate-binding protein [Stackebrandtia endophytica]TQL78151.1 amino acid/amide ABC transporter substrate-binding protein (HAAT family) [Stackebrandtia endophytica]